MPEEAAAGGLSPAEFAEILSTGDLPLIVGGQAINIWAESYAGRVAGLEGFLPFTSRDADIHGSRAQAEAIARR
ncbi:MAG: hypothetical protein RLZZ15_2858, partial [Verrucomicrobiota bacterium]